MCFAHPRFSHAGSGRGQSAMELPTADGTPADAAEDAAGAATGPGGGGGMGGCARPSAPGPGLPRERLVPRIRALLCEEGTKVREGCSL